MSLAWISVGALVIAVTLSCTTTINVGVLSLALALIVGVYLGGMSPDAVLDGFPIAAARDARRRHAALQHRRGQRHAGARDRARRAPVPRARRRCCRSCSSCSGLVIATIGAGAHAGQRAAGAAGDGGGRAGRHPAAADGDHGRQRRAGRHAVAVRADRHRRPRRDGAHRPWRRRVADVRLQRARAHDRRRSAAFCVLGGWKLFVAARQDACAAEEPDAGADGNAATG